MSSSSMSRVSPSPLMYARIAVLSQRVQLSPMAPLSEGGTAEAEAGAQHEQAIGEWCEHAVAVDVESRQSGTTASRCANMPSVVAVLIGLRQATTKPVGPMRRPRGWSWFSGV